MHKVEAVWRLWYPFPSHCSHLWRLSRIQCENASLKEQMDTISKELEITKEKLHTIEQAWEQEIKLGESYHRESQVISV